MKLKACIFDLDGVIVDTAKYHFLAWQNLGRRLGFEFEERHNERLKGVSRKRSLEILLSVGGLSHKYSVNDRARMESEKNAEYLAYVAKMTPEEILPGVVSFLMELRDAGIGVGLGSASRNARTILEQVGITSLFDIIVDGTVVTKAKPDPEIFLRAAYLLDVEPQNCVVFEDAVAGVDAAQAAGMKCIGVGDHEILKDANMVVGGFQNLTYDSFKHIISKL